MFNIERYSNTGNSMLSLFINGRYVAQSTDVGYLMSKFTLECESDEFKIIKGNGDLVVRGYYSSGKKL